MTYTVKEIEEIWDTLATTLQIGRVCGFDACGLRKAVRIHGNDGHVKNRVDPKRLRSRLCIYFGWPGAV